MLLSATDCRRESGGDSSTKLIEWAETGNPVCTTYIREDEREQRKKALHTTRETHNTQPRISRVECSRRGSRFQTNSIRGGETEVFPPGVRNS